MQPPINILADTWGSTSMYRQVCAIAGTLFATARPRSARCRKKRTPRCAGGQSQTSRCHATANSGTTTTFGCRHKARGCAHARPSGSDAACLSAARAQSLRSPPPHEKVDPGLSIVDTGNQPYRKSMVGQQTVALFNLPNPRRQNCPARPYRCRARRSASRTHRSACRAAAPGASRRRGSRSNGW